MCVFSRVQIFVASWTIAHQVPLSMEFSRQEYRSGFPFPTPGDLPNLGIELLFLESPALAGRFFTTMPRMCCAVFSRSVVSDSVTPWTVAYQASLSMEILQARILEWVSMPSSRGFTQARD